VDSPRCGTNRNGTRFSPLWYQTKRYQTKRDTDLDRDGDRLMLALALMVTSLHLFVDSRRDVSGLVDRFRPQVHVHPPVVLVGEVDQYTKARICVANIDDHVGIMQYNDGVMHMHICTYRDSVLTIQSCLWGVRGADKAAAFASLIEWFEQLEPCGVVVCGSSIGGTERIECRKQGGI